MSSFLAQDPTISENEKFSDIDADLGSQARIEESSAEIETPEEASFETIIGLTPFLKQEDEEFSDRNRVLVIFASSVKRLDDVLRIENSLLEQNDLSRLQEMTNRKTRGLQDLSMAVAHARTFDTEEVKAFIQQALGYLQQTLERNEELLAMQLDAVSDVAAVIKEAEEAKETDGTYRPVKEKIEQGS